ncbi:RHS repeat-associated core domain-containing protein [Zooshikella ganghwensis]|uniref:RHS repeat-associated core domain-containing protein n=2 Tax=Zooshikella ganghwensis TaxID=202772 RepID=A0A4P9VJ37_9GAMM|nr:RHS repeat-associated core domain-containing protein [Zooshikella ganghwensis]
MFLLGDNVQYYHADALGSITTLTDAQGKTSASQVYNSWGAVNSKLSSGSIPLYGYTGREPDATGLIYYRTRYYDPDTARFTQLDPKGFIDGVNRYAYALNSPMMFIDPWGTSAVKGANGSGSKSSTIGGGTFGSMLVAGGLYNLGDPNAFANIARSEGGTTYNTYDSINSSKYVVAAATVYLAVKSAKGLKIKGHSPSLRNPDSIDQIKKDGSIWIPRGLYQ